MNLEINKATQEEKTPEFIESIKKVWELSVRATHDFLKEEDILFYKSELNEPIFIGIDLYYIREEDEELIGFMGINEYHLEMLFIHPNCRGKGIGKKFIRFAIESLNVNSVDVNEQNIQGIGFYKKMGFVCVNKSEIDPYGKPYPILHLKLKE